MIEKTEIENRVAELEAKVSYQDDVIEKLNLTVIDQWKQIELQGRQLLELRGRLEHAERNLTGDGPEVPPHY